MWFLFASLTVLAWSGADLFYKKGADPGDPYSHWRTVMMVGLVMGLHAIIYYGIICGEPFSPINMIRYLPVSSMYILSMTLGYVGLRYIDLSVCSPISNSSGAVTALLCFLVLGQRMSGLQFGAVIAICFGILGLSVIEKKKADRERAEAGEAVDKKYSASAIAILFPILYCIVDGLGTFGDAFYLNEDNPIFTENQANMAYEMTFLLVAVFAMVYLVLVRKQKLVSTGTGPLTGAALLETAGQFVYVYAISTNAIVAAPMIASYSIFSVLWSRIFLKEKLSRGQYAMIVLVMIGIAILGVE
ncbi:MAG: DMT family transporter [Oscillospiraceae bacterium]|nr:DMT family transporter [Oscillospiraceae bacterium]